MVKFKKEKVKSFMVIVSCLLSVATFMTVAVGMSKSAKTTATVRGVEYTRGNVNNSGNIIESKKSIVMKDTKNVDGLAIDIDEENATVTYRVVFYGEDGEYLSTTESMAADYEEEITPDGAETFRIVVTPNQVDGEDVQIGALSVGKYAKQLDITYNK